MTDIDRPVDDSPKIRDGNAFITTGKCSPACPGGEQMTGRAAEPRPNPLSK